MFDKINPADDGRNEAGPSGHGRPVAYNFPAISSFGTLINPTGHELAGTSHPDPELDETDPPDHMHNETSPPDHEGPEHYNGPTTSSYSTLSSPPEPQGPALNAGPAADVATAPPPVLDTSGEGILMLFGYNNSLLGSSHSLAESPQEMELYP